MFLKQCALLCNTVAYIFFLLCVITGWVNRGRFTGPHGGDVQARAEEALDLAADFLSKHLMSV
jgi:hypothetical protein